MNVEFPWEGLQPTFAETYTLELFKISSHTCKHLKAANTLKSGLFGIANQRFTGFGHQLQPARSRESHSPDLLAQDSGIVEETSLSVAANTWVGEAGELERLATAHHPGI